MTDTQKKYADGFAALLNEWKDGKIEFDRSSAIAAGFDKKVESYKVRQQTDNAEKAISLDFILQNWKLLPDTVKAEKPLSLGAQYVLIGGIIDAAEQLEKNGISPDPQSLKKALDFSLYVTLGAAQEEAKKANLESITATSVRRGGVWLFSFGWPWCCGDE
ncbi:MAG: hypothetical protein ACT4SY_11015 [Hyphomicrobiales bacterium]